MTLQLPVCSVCNRRDAPNYFRVQEVTPGGVESPLTTTCSVKCLMTWLYKYAAFKGTMLAVKTKGVVQQFLDGLKGLR